MLVYLALVAGLVVWLVMWSVGFNSFDAFMVCIAIVLGAAGLKTLLPFLPGNRGGPEQPGSGRSWIPR